MKASFASDMNINGLVTLRPHMTRNENKLELSFIHFNAFLVFHTHTQTHSQSAPRAIIKMQFAVFTLFFLHARINFVLNGCTWKIKLHQYQYHLDKTNNIIINSTCMNWTNYLSALYFFKSLTQVYNNFLIFICFSFFYRLYHLKGCKLELMFYFSTSITFVPYNIQNSSIDITSFIATLYP